MAETEAPQFGPERVLMGYDRHLEFLRRQVYVDSNVPLRQKEILHGQMTRITISRDEFLLQSEMVAVQIAETPREYLGEVTLVHGVFEWPEEDAPVLEITPPYAVPVGELATSSAMAA
ncbi:MAG: hypothetical protein ACHQT9_04755 [Candidatus Saccharimonadales bacterium]